MRRASSVECFPYKNPNNCYIEVLLDGTVRGIAHKNKSDINEIEAAYVRVCNRESRLFCAWPGNYSTNLFEIDDLNAFADAFGFICETNSDEHIHSFTWEVDEKNSTSRTAYVRIKFACDCESPLYDSREKFDTFLQKHLDWSVATSRGRGGSSGAGGVEVGLYVHLATLDGRKGSFNMDAEK